MADKMLRLSLEVEPDSEPVKGSLAPEHGQPRAFQGWMELAATLLALTEAPAARSHPAVPSRAGSDPRSDAVSSPQTSPVHRHVP